MTFPRTTIALALFAGLSLSHLSVAQGLSGPDRLSIALEALSRVEGDPSTNAALKGAIYGVLEQVRNKPEFVEIVKKFKITDQNAGLLAFAQANPASEPGVEAIRMILAADDFKMLETAIQTGDSGGNAKVIEALGNAKDKKAVAVLLPVITDLKHGFLTRKMTVRSLVQTQEGATELIKLAREEKLPADLRLAATEQLNAVRWPKIKAEAEKILPLPRSNNAGSLPPIAELLKLKGNATEGEKIFFTEAVACSGCHQVRKQGIEIGPNLSEIGTKLAREALFEAILDPSAGISFGFEAHQVELKSGDEAYGLLASETEDEISIKDLKGIVTKLKKADIAKRKQLTTSIMPAGLVEGLTAQQLVDLVEYLSSLKKAGE